MQHASAITQFVIAEFLPDVPVEELAPDTDLLDEGIIDSLGLLKLLVWLEDAYGIRAEDVELDPDSFRSIAAIDAFITAATAGPVDAK
ncbi:phosphopantetheine-binding protein [Saccharopolyspora sp. 5N708]|uniref:phosphopantetheine-binding protein n=1 Tax=Saccharopolyspora sp. 5N708 TaxID=3457424 RepID=UPI003FD0CA9C